MKAAIFSSGNEVNVQEVSEPTPKANEVKIKVKAAGICGSDLHGWRSDKLWFPEVAPIILGHELAGEIVEVGSAVTRLKPGDRVAVQPQITCGKCRLCKMGLFQLCPDVRHIGIWYPGGFAEYTCVPESNAFLIPDGLSFEAASMVDVYGCAVHCSHRVNVKVEDTVVVLGTGAIGMTTAQVLRLQGPRQLIIVGTRDESLVVAKKVGAADVTINLKKTDPISAIDELTGGNGADIVIEAVGGQADTLKTAFEVAALNGTIGIMGEFFGSRPIPVQRGMEKQINLLWVTGYANWNGISEFGTTVYLLASGRVDPTAIITHRFPLEQIREGFEAAADKIKSGAVKVLILP